MLPAILIGLILPLVVVPLVRFFLYKHSPEYNDFRHWRNVYIVVAVFGVAVSVIFFC